MKRRRGKRKELEWTGSEYPKCPKTLVQDDVCIHQTQNDRIDRESSEEQHEQKIQRNTTVTINLTSHPRYLLSKLGYWEGSAVGGIILPIFRHHRFPSLHQFSWAAPLSLSAKNIEAKNTTRNTLYLFLL